MMGFLFRHAWLVLKLRHQQRCIVPAWSAVQPSCKMITFPAVFPHFCFANSLPFNSGSNRQEMVVATGLNQYRRLRVAGST
jgi:hypothetical protein